MNSRRRCLVSLLLSSKSAFLIEFALVDTLLFSLHLSVQVSPATIDALLSCHQTAHLENPSFGLEARDDLPLQVRLRNLYLLHDRVLDIGQDRRRCRGGF